jgi:hypothetical protein
MFTLCVQSCHIILGPPFFPLPRSFDLFPQSHHEEKIRSNQQQDSFPQWVGTPFPPTAMTCAVKCQPRPWVAADCFCHCDCLTRKQSWLCSVMQRGPTCYAFFRALFVYKLIKIISYIYHTLHYTSHIIYKV